MFEKLPSEVELKIAAAVVETLVQNGTRLERFCTCEEEYDTTWRMIDCVDNEIAAGRDAIDVLRKVMVKLEAGELWRKEIGGV